jgi:NAD(P)-dependent dehydrogenase (short-subunit alcohol dehydrogenase family)
VASALGPDHHPERVDVVFVAESDDAADPRPDQDLDPGRPVRQARRLRGGVEFLASDDARFVTGQTIPVDGGTLAASGWYARADRKGWTNTPNEA